jgi:hypothetical protein
MRIVEVGMADQDRPNRSANKNKREGERWSSEENTVRDADRDENPEQLYDAEEVLNRNDNDLYETPRRYENTDDTD